VEGSNKHYVDNSAELSSVGMIIRQKEPKNLEAPFDRIDSYLTPTELFYIRSHFPIPNLDRGSYRLRTDGAVGNPFTFSYEELVAIRDGSRPWSARAAAGTSSHKCKAHGGAWSSQQRGVDRCAPASAAGAADLAEDSADRARRSDRGLQRRAGSSHPISYAESPQGDQEAGVLIAYQMNGRDLRRIRFPVRAIVRTLWNGFRQGLTHIHVVRESFDGYWQTIMPTELIDGKPVRRALGEMQPVRNRATGVYETLAPNRIYTVFGAAWAGEPTWSRSR
jgi:DMSO/TMAO reductase YedYZ molybdopterin-dependent catalytic subunit